VEEGRESFLSRDRAVKAFLRGLLERAYALLPCKCCAFLLFEYEAPWGIELHFPPECAEWAEAIRSLLPWSPRERRRPPPVTRPAAPWKGASEAAFFPLHHYARGTLGAMALGLPSSASLTEKATALAQSLADQASLLVVQALYRQRLQTVYALAEQLTQLKTEEEVIAAAVRILREAFRYGHVGLYLREGDELFSCGGDYSEPFAEYEEVFQPFKRLPLDKGICGRVFRTGKSALVPDVRRDPDYVGAHPSIRSELAVPIVAGDEVLGLINIESPEVGAFNREDQELLESLGRQLGIALSELRHRRDLVARESFLRALNETADFGELLRYLLERSLEVLYPKADVGGVLVYDAARGCYELRLVTEGSFEKRGGMEYPEDHVSAVLPPDRPTLLRSSDFFAEALWGGGALPPGGVLPRSAVVIPVRDPRADRAIAYLYVGTTREERPLTAEDADKLWAFHKEITAVVLRARDLEKIRDLAFRDPLTGVYNRHFLDHLVEEILSEPDERWFPLSLVIIDIDSFSEVNDRFGHLAGDRVLRELARILMRNVRATDVVVRYGGDEFLILMPSTPRDKAEVALGRLHRLVAGWNPGLEEVRLSISFGIAAWDPREGMGFEEAVEAADTSLYRQRGAHQGS